MQADDRLRRARSALHKCLVNVEIHGAASGQSRREVRPFKLGTQGTMHLH